ncbi:MAG: hypothetical protein K5930_04970 [Treponemataceae bacterium]|nr:hypothetical protein [Treponemataceae bacterium]
MKILSFLKKEPVLVAALVLALVALCLVQPSFETVLAAIDFRVLSLLFCLMGIIAAFRSVNVLDAFACKVLKICKSETGVFFALTFLVFFISMLVTNDVALLTFVPISLIICGKASFSRRKCIELVVIETLAANLGSCMTPMGNPQNLFLYSFYGMTAGEFFPVVLKIGLPSLLLLALAVLKASDKKKKIIVTVDTVKVQSPVKTLVYTAVLVLILLSVFRVVDYRISLAVCLVCLALMNWRLFAKIDYCLLLTFTGFFIFTGCISKVPAVSSFLRNMLETPLSCYLTGIVTSQVISNVPAALLLAGFTSFSEPLLLAVNVGGLGTLIASLASVISYKLYNSWIDEQPTEPDVAPDSGAKTAPDFANGYQNSAKSPRKVSYMAVFTVYNIIFLAIIGLVAWLLFLMF